jgi:hypothetical protein
MAPQDVAVDPATNGHRPLEGDEAIIAAMEAQSAAVRARAEELRAELERISPEVRRYEKAIAALRGEPLSAGGRPKASTAPKRPREGRGTSGAVVERIRVAILEFAADRDEFNQAEIRALTGDSSGKSSLAFEQLRQDGVIRLSRREGPRKWFRLTQGAAAARSDDEQA